MPLTSAEVAARRAEITSPGIRTAIRLAADTALSETVELMTTAEGQNRNEDAKLLLLRSHSAATLFELINGAIDKILVSKSLLRHFVPQH